ncbi:VOC family protein [Synechococcus sp. W4D4]|uniref:VOC family protein n=1 Tax=Synechococcus sp. W4D4 TaxID=3392294 RepID=UPI0039E945ED
MSSQPPPSVGLVLAADEPASLARFYGVVSGAGVQPGLSQTHWRVPLPGSGWLEIYAPSRSRPLPRQRGRLALAIHLLGGELALSTAVARAQEHGAQLVEPTRQEPFGWEAWLNDPEGNALLLIAREAGE